MSKSTGNILTGGWLKGKKTYIAAVLGIVTAITSYVTGDLYLEDLIQTVFPLLAIIFVRKGLSDK